MAETASSENTRFLGRNGSQGQEGQGQEHGRGRGRRSRGSAPPGRRPDREFANSARACSKAVVTITTGDIAIFSRQLATMLAAGIPLVQAFEIVGNGHDNAAMQKLILAIKADVEGGSALAEALAKHPLYFDDLFVNLVEAGEQAGALETLLDKIATYKEKTEAIKKKIKKALTYPAAVLVVAFIVTTILLIFVIPAFEDLFQGFGADLPAFTRMVIDLSAIRASPGLVFWIGIMVRRSVRSSTSRSARGRCVTSSTA